MLELADRHDLGSCAERRAGSTPAFPTLNIFSMFDFLHNHATLSIMRKEPGKIDIAFILILLVIIVVLLYILAPQNIRINDPGFMVQYWQNISRAFSDIGRSLSNVLQSLGRGITNLFSNISIR